MITKLKVALVSTYPPGQGTLNEYGYHLVRALRAHPCISELTVIADRLPDGARYEPAPGEGCKVSIVEAWRFNGWLNPWKIIRAVRKARPDIVLFNIQFLSFGDGKVQAALGLLTPFFLRVCGYHSVLLLHNILEQVDLRSAGITQNRLLAVIYNFIGTMLSRFVLSADLVAVTISKYVRVLEEKYKAKNVALVPHGSFEITPMPSLELPLGPARVMTFGKFGTYKKVEVMIEAVLLLRKKCNIQAEIVIAGTDSPNRKGYLEEVRQRYAHVPGIVFTGYVPEEAVPALFAESAVVVFPYTSTTGSSGVLHQAGNYAKAVILPAIGDLDELIREEGYAGELFKPDDAESLSIALQRVLGDDAYRRSLSIKNYFAAVSLPMKEIVDWYYIHFLSVLKKLPG